MRGPASNQVSVTNIATPHHGALKVILLVLGIVEVAAGATLIGGSSLFAPAVAAQLGMMPVLAAAMLCGFGLLALGIGYLLLIASREPVRYVGIIDVLIFLLLAGAVLGLYIGLNLHVFAGSLVWAGTAARIALAIILLALRPKETSPLLPGEPS
jgi:hypothetical protein